MPSDFGAADETDSTRMVASDLRQHSRPPSTNRPTATGSDAERQAGTEASARQIGFAAWRPRVHVVSDACDKDQGLRIVGRAPAALCRSALGGSGSGGAGKVRLSW